MSGCGNIIGPINHYNLGPFVEIKLAGNTVTVGNKSSPPNNTAVVKSFEWGASNGLTVNVEILDQEGGSFQKIADRLQRCLDSKASTLNAKWGWLWKDCNGKTGIDFVEGSVNMTHMDINYADGKIKYKIKGVDNIESAANTTQNKIFGQEGKKMKLLIALQKLFENNKPSLKLETLDMKGEGPFIWEKYGVNGPPGIYDTENQPTIATARRWTSEYFSINGKGGVFIMDEKNNRVIYKEDGLTHLCGPGLKGCQGVIGGYYINSGKNSPVISFSPKINWPVSAVQFRRGGSGGSSYNSTTENLNETVCESGRKGKNKPNDPDAGSKQNINTSQNVIESEGPKNAASKAAKGNDAALRGNAAESKNLNPITAELRVQGVPDIKFVGPHRFRDKTLALTVYNPYYLGGGCNWLQQPKENDYLTNKRWMIKGISHQIQEGSYVTTFELFLPTPAIMCGANEPLGCDPSGHVPDSC